VNIKLRTALAALVVASGMALAAPATAAAAAPAASGTHVQAAPTADDGFWFRGRHRHRFPFRFGGGFPVVSPFFGGGFDGGFGFGGFGGCDIFLQIGDLQSYILCRVG
jgi:hypothetical protein